MSVVIAVMNEEENIRPLLASLRENLTQINHEIIFVDDGSTDKTVPEILANGYDAVRVIEFTKNYGQSIAMQAGIDQSKGAYIVTLDGDLQNDPKDIPMLLEKIENEP
ncbi:MAG: glycosyltransferase, partial [Bacteroidota bacterium]|nr:glycosyltransferase [Bacteroidota bacterium]